MCLQCDGYSEEELDRQTDLAIRVHGYHYIQVYDPAEPGGTDSAWTYTVGLAENFGEPDLICIGVKPKVQAALLEGLAEVVVQDGMIDPEVLTDLDVELVGVHADHLSDGLVGEWDARYGPAQAGDYLQVLPGASWFCACHGSKVQRMDDPTPLDKVGYRGRAA